MLFDTRNLFWIEYTIESEEERRNKVCFSIYLFRLFFFLFFFFFFVFFFLSLFVTIYISISSQIYSLIPCRYTLVPTGIYNNSRKTSRNNFAHFFFFVNITFLYKLFHFFSFFFLFFLIGFACPRITVRDDRHTKATSL